MHLSDLQRRQAPLKLLELRGEVPRGWYFGAGVTFIGMFVLAWIAATAAGIVAPMFLPSPGAVLAELGSQAAGRHALD